MATKDSERRNDLAWDDPSLAGGTSTISDAILSVNVNYSMDSVSEITVRVHDSNFALSRSNYFSIGRHVWFRGYSMAQFGGSSNTRPSSGNRVWQLYEIGNATMSPGPGISPVWDLKLRPAGIQQLKRDKTPATIAGTGSNYVINAAQKYGLKAVAQHTVGGAETWKAQSEYEVKESVWDVMRRVASDNRQEEGHARFLLFEADGVIFFGTQRWLLGKWGSQAATRDVSLIDPDVTVSQMNTYNFVELAWPPRRTGSPTDIFQMMSLPKITRTDNAPIATEGSVDLDRFNARALRPGMTIFLNLKECPYYNGMYLITTVTFEHIGNNAVSISFRSPERLAKNIRMLEVGSTRAQTVGRFSDI